MGNLFGNCSIPSQSIPNDLTEPIYEVDEADVEPAQENTTPASTSEQEPSHICKDCGKEITTAGAKDGATIETIVAASQKHCHCDLCTECLKKRVEKKKAEKAAQADIEQQPTKYICEDCGCEITSEGLKKGKTAADVAAVGKEKYGHVLCVKCYRKREANSKSAA